MGHSAETHKSRRRVIVDFVVDGAAGGTRAAVVVFCSDWKSPATESSMESHIRALYLIQELPSTMQKGLNV